MQGRATGGLIGRTGLALAAFGLVVAGVVIATDDVRPPALALSRAAVVDCGPARPYVAPEPGSTGVPAGLPLCRSGPVTVSEPGAVLDGLDVRGGIVVDAPGVVVRRSRVSGDGVTPYGLTTTPSGSVRVEDTTFTGDFPQAAIGGDRWTGERVEITSVTHDGARLGDGARLRNSGLSGVTPAQGDGLVVDGADVTVEDNRIAGPAGGSAVRVAAAGPGGGVLIRGNVLGGGRWTLHVLSGEAWITDNRFRRDAGVGPVRVSPGAVLVDNAYVDGGPLPAR